MDVRVKKEQEEKVQKGKEKVEACLYTMIKLARDEDLGEQIGKEIYFDLVGHDKVHTIRIQKQMLFTEFKGEVAKAFGIPVQFQRYWLWAKRENNTYRPNHALTAQEEIQPVGELREVSNKWNNDELKLFLEVELCLDLRPLHPPGKTTREEILIFLKLYDPLKETIRYVGHLFVKGGGKPLEIKTKLKELAGFSPDEEIELFEEIKFEPSVMCERIDSMLSFCECQLEDGDIICFQKSIQNQCSEQYRFPEVPSFLEYMHNRQGKDKAEAGLYTFSSATPNGFAFGASSSFFTPTTTAAVFGSAPSTPSGPAFPFGSTSLTNSSPQPIFGTSTSFTASPGNNNQMSMEDSMAKDTTHASSPAVPFGQPSVSPSPGGFVFGSTPSPFQFGGQQNQAAAQNPSPFAASGCLGGGGSFFLGSNGPDRSGRKIIKVDRNKNRRK